MLPCARSVSESVDRWGLQGVIGRREVPWSCGYAQYTDLMVERAGIYTLQFSSVIKDVSFLLESANFTIVRGSVHHLGMSLEPAGFRPNYAFKTQVCAQSKFRSPLFACVSHTSRLERFCFPLILVLCAKSLWCCFSTQQTTSSMVMTEIYK